MQPRHAEPPAHTAQPGAPEKGDKLGELRKLIEDEKKKRMDIIREVKAARNKLQYKIADKASISQLSEISKSRTKNLGFLRKRKEQLEFRIATEAFTLEAEKDLIRKKNGVEAELEEALKSYRLRRKLEFIEKDIVDIGKRIDELEAKIKESDKKLDELYSNLRAITGEARRAQRSDRPRQPREQKKPAEISIADIAIMKDKKGDKGKESELDESVLN